MGLRGDLPCQRGLQALRLDGFRQIVVHTGGETAFAIPLHGVCSQCDYGRPGTGPFFASAGVLKVQDVAGSQLIEQGWGREVGVSCCPAKVSTGAPEGRLYGLFGGGRLIAGDGDLLEERDWGGHLHYFPLPVGRYRNRGIDHLGPFLYWPVSFKEYPRKIGT